jgi:thymidine phosphorylase
MASPRMVLKPLGIKTYKEAVLYMRADSPVCLSEGFEVPARVLVTLNGLSIIATLNIINSSLLATNEASLSEYAWDYLRAKTGDEIIVSHSKPVLSLSAVRSKLYGNNLSEKEIREIIDDIVLGQYSDINLTMFLSASSGNRLTQDEIFYLTKAMIESGEKLKWHTDFIVDKHCVGGLPGNRTSLIIVPIVAAYGLTIPKTSSRAITSPAGTADTMEVFSPVNLSLKTMQRVVEKENGCIAWGGSVSLSPADDLLIRIERAMDIDSEGQMIASILSKKIAAGSTHIVIDIPIGETAKVRTLESANLLSKYLTETGKKFGIEIKVIFTDGAQPIGRGIGPALEARDVLDILQGEKNILQDLRERSLMLAGKIIEFDRKIADGKGYLIAKELLDSGKALSKFYGICNAQGGFAEPELAPYTHIVLSKKSGVIVEINNRRLASVAKLAGAPLAKMAGVRLHVKVGDHIEKNQPLYIVYAESLGELDYAISYVDAVNNIITIKVE